MSMLKDIKAKLFPKLNDSLRDFEIPEFAQEDKIPKLIHQTFFSNSTPPLPLPSEIEENIAFLKSLNPAWEHRLYDKDQMVGFIETHYGADILKCFNRIDPSYGAAQADFFRYLLMYKCGGVYLDIKSSISAPLDSFLLDDDTYIISQWRNKKNEEFEGWGLHYDLREIQGGEFQQWHIIAAPGHPFLRAVIQRVLTNFDLYLPSLHGVGKNGVLRLTGPTAYTLAISPLLKSYGHRIITSEMPFPLKYSIYDYDSHISVFKSHYSSLSSPVIKISRTRQAISEVVAGLNKIDNAFRNK
jgi:hypothetical protein